MSYVTTRAIERLVRLMGLGIAERIADGELPKRCAACGDATLGPDCGMGERPTTPGDGRANHRSSSARKLGPARP